MACMNVVKPIRARMLVEKLARGINPNAKQPNNGSSGQRLRRSETDAILQKWH